MPAILSLTFLAGNVLHFLGLEDSRARSGHSMSMSTGTFCARADFIPQPVTSAIFTSHLYDNEAAPHPRRSRARPLTLRYHAIRPRHQSRGTSSPYTGITTLPTHPASPSTSPRSPGSSSPPYRLLLPNALSPPSTRTAPSFNTACISHTTAKDWSCSSRKAQMSRS
jgi:hypothetical protein